MTATEADIIEDCRRWIAAAGGPREWNDTRELWLARAARRLGIPRSRAASLFYRKARGITALEYLTLKARIEALEAAAARRRRNLHEMERALLVANGMDRGRDQQLGDPDGRTPAQGRLF